MNIDFKEKPYETAFSSELTRWTNIFYSPDQVDEYYYGFDGSYFIDPFRVPHLFPIPSRTRHRWLLEGMSLHEIEELDERFGELMPNYRLNLFVQFKRPELLKSKGAKEWSEWRCPYYRYEITPHQQMALERIEQKSAGRASVVYASPAFATASELFDFIKQCTICDNSNITNASRLASHGRYTYVAPGFIGKGHSETESIESDPFFPSIARALETQEAVPFSDHVKKIAYTVQSVTSENEASLLMAAAMRANGGNVYSEQSLSRALATLDAFCDAFNVTYIALG